MNRARPQVKLHPPRGRSGALTGAATASVAAVLGATVLLAAACGSNAAPPKSTGSHPGTSAHHDQVSGGGSTTDSSAALVKTAKVGTLGTILVTTKGLALYTYAPD